MSQQSEIVPLRADTVAGDKMLVTMTASDLRQLIGEIVEQKLKLVSTVRGSLLTADQAAEFLGYSKDWVYKNWQKIGGRKPGGKGLRFDAAELQGWVESRKSD
jgi:excisionase family DNA binding protein